MEIIVSDDHGNRGELVFKLELLVQFTDPMASFHLILDCLELKSDGSVVDLIPLLTSAKRWWENKGSVSMSEATMLLWKVITEHLVDTKQIERVRCSEVRVAPAEGVSVSFTPVEDSIGEL